MSLVKGMEPDPGKTAFDFRDLRYFVTVAEELHFGRAAQRLFLTQPALSHAIARLETALGVRLLQRDRHHVEHTPAGAELLTRARRLLAEREETIARVRSVGNGVAGVLRVGVAMLSEDDIEPALTSLAGVQPALVIDRSAAMSERLLTQLRERRLDTAFVHQVPALVTMDDVEWELVRVSRLVARLSCSHPLASSEAVALAQLHDETFLVNPRQLAPSAFEGLKLMCQHFGGFEPKLLECAATSTLPRGPGLHLIQDGSAIALTTECAARSVIAEHTATVMIKPPPACALALAWRRGDPSLLLECFLDVVRTFRDQCGWTSGKPD